jgi:hypothetical protein
MLGDIKVFSPKGKLLKVINAQEIYDAKYAEISASLGKTAWGKVVKKAKTRPITCPICKIELQGRANQITCGSDKCIRIRGQIKKFPNSTRLFNCAGCGIEVETRHHNKRTCGLDKCFRAYNNSREKARLKKLKEIQLSG